MIKCIHCGEEIHPKRLEILPLAKTCVVCSTTGKKGGLTVMKGTGDHTWVEIIPIEHEDYQKLIKEESKNFNTSFDNLEPEFNSEI